MALTRSELRWAGCCAAAVWLIFVPVFENNTSHFSWGFFPSLLSRLLLPLIIILGTVDSVFRLLECRKNSIGSNGQSWAIALLPLVPAIWAGYWVWQIFVR